MQVTPLDTPDIVLRALYDDLEQFSLSETSATAQEQRALELSSLTRKIRFQVGPPWHHTPATIDAIAERFADAVAHLGQPSSPLVRTSVKNVLQRMIFLLQDKQGPTENLWLRQREALQSDSRQE